jgi:hypothetical protein
MSTPLLRAPAHPLALDASYVASLTSACAKLPEHERDLLGPPLVELVRLSILSGEGAQSAAIAALAGSCLQHLARALRQAAPSPQRGECLALAALATLQLEVRDA